MSNVIYIDNAFFRLTQDSNSIRVLEPYIRVREEINRRFNPIAGGSDWEAVKENCEVLARGPGIDFMMCGYYTVACLKTQGLAGFATGLELLSSSLANQSSGDTKTAKMRKELLDWVNGRVVQELKALKPDHGTLRELYRAERFCDRLHQLVEKQSTDYKVDFEGVGFALFEHIDRIETQYHNLLKKQERSEPLKLKFWQKGLGMSVIAVCAVVVGALAGWKGWPWYYSTPYGEPQLISKINDTQQAKLFVEQSSDKQRARWQKDLVPLYGEALEHHMLESFSDSKRQAMAHVQLLKTLYPQDDKTTQLNAMFSEQQKVALEQTELFVAKFSDIRTKTANISLLAKRGKWRDLQKQTKSLEAFAISLSPIYGRVDYVQELIKNGELETAEKEFDILKDRLNNLSWKIAVLEQEIDSSGSVTQ